MINQEWFRLMSLVFTESVLLYYYNGQHSQVIGLYWDLQTISI
jgi:hypothetical protein